LGIKKQKRKYLEKSEKHALKEELETKVENLTKRISDKTRRK
jgi:hypothetical protein